MKKVYILIALLATVGSYAQDTIRTLQGNNVNATINNSSHFFHDPSSLGSGYESPKGSTNHLIYSSSFWFGAKDAFGNLKMAADRVGGEDYRDTYPGALSADGSAEAPVPSYATDIYIVSKAEIEYHVTNIYTLGYIIPYGILQWPAHGDVSLGLDFQLAPFADLNGNGLYEPEIGEYPEIRGDHAAYLIMNDKAGPHLQSGGDPLGIEIHYMFYQYETGDDINNTTFVNVRVINRSSQNYSEFVVGTFMDSDIGYGLNDDDYLGCNPENNLMFGYNGDNFDEGGGSQVGYGLNPPAIGVMSLNHTMNVCIVGLSGGGPLYVGPITVVDYWNYMHAIWPDGAHLTYGEDGRNPASTPTNYMHDGNPNEFVDPAEWNEVNVGNPKGDRRAVMASESFELNAGGVLCFDYAFITSRGGNNFENAEGLILQAPSIKSFYDGQPNIYCDYSLALEENEKDEVVHVFPNPSAGTFMIDITGVFDLEIHALDGRVVYHGNTLSGGLPIATFLTNGTYIILITQNNKRYQSKIVINN